MNRGYQEHRPAGIPPYNDMEYWGRTWPGLEPIWKSLDGFIFLSDGSSGRPHIDDWRVDYQKAYSDVIRRTDGKEYYTVLDWYYAHRGVAVHINAMGGGAGWRSVIEDRCDQIDDFNFRIVFRKLFGGSEKITVGAQELVRIGY